MRRAALISLALLLSISAWAQEQARRPLDVPMSFAGNYGELRHDHFHSGVDWRVGGKVGDPVHAIKDGYVSRVSVSPWGYGNGLYIVHPDGTTSVYGHLHEFRQDIAARVEEEQYAQESFTVNLYFQPDEFPVKRGDVVAKVGNTGSSAGPHLHMEIRDTESDLSLNYISRGVYKPADKTSPQFHRVCLYGLEDGVVERSWRVYNLKEPASVRDTLALPPRSYVAMDVTDRQEGTTGKLAVEEYRVWLDTTLIFSFKVGEMPASEGRYIRTLIEYGESARGGRDLVKSRVEPGNRLADRITCRSNGVIELRDDAVHTVRLEAFDEHGNRATVRYRIRCDADLHTPDPDPAVQSMPWLWYSQNEVNDGSLTYIVPAGALYDNIEFTWRKIADPDPEHGIVSDVWQVGSPDIPQHLPGELEIAADVPEELEGKAYVANYGQTLTHAGVQVRFGTYCVAIDTVAPTATFLGVKGNIVDGETIRIRVKDDASGVASARIEIDGRWYLSLFKRDIVSLELRENRLRRGNHTLTLTLTDYCGNESTQSRDFSY